MIRAFLVAKHDESNDSEVSIATKDVLLSSDNEDNALNSSDKEHIGTITSQLQTQPAKSPMQDKSSIKSSTLNSKHVDILGEMRRDNNDQNYKLVSDLSKTNKKQPNK